MIYIIFELPHYVALPLLVQCLRFSTRWRHHGPHNVGDPPLGGTTTARGVSAAGSPLDVIRTEVYFHRVSLSCRLVRVLASAISLRLGTKYGAYRTTVGVPLHMWYSVAGNQGVNPRSDHFILFCAITMYRHLTVGDLFECCMSRKYKYE